MKKKPHSDPIDYHAFLQPEQDIESSFLKDDEFIAGLDWGKPRYGHPEGQIYKHIRHVLNNIDRLGADHPLRPALRIVAFVHDTFKYKEDKSYPRDWSKHHSVYARKFLEKYTDDPAVITVTEHHDEAYHCWCLKFLYNQEELSNRRLKKLLDNLGDFTQLYYLFFKCDTKTGDKNPSPLRWFEQTVPNITITEI
ncbi:MAG TPA: hypothetical protein VJ953_00975 [Saprospiraceae bacterium]|nr:hypothetical protein [Saprospiraceae bacterium]